MRGNAAPAISDRSRASSDSPLGHQPADARWLSIVESVALKCHVPDNWSAIFDRVVMRQVSAPMEPGRDLGLLLRRNMMKAKVAGDESMRS